MSEKIEWKLEKRKVQDLIEWGKNPRILMAKGIADLKASIEKFGCAQPIIINTDNVICGGHGRKKVLIELEIEEIDCYVPSRTLTEKEFEELNIRLNRVAAGKFDFEILANQFEMADLTNWGFESSDFLGLNLEEKKEIIEDEAPALKEKSFVRRGDLWRLGNHFLYCADSANLADVEKLRGGAVMDGAFLDPPYNLDYDFANNGMVQTGQRKAKHGKIQNDSMSDEAFDQFITDVFTNLLVSLKDGGSYYISGGRESTMIFNQVLKKLEFHIQSWLIWAKTHFNISRLDYHPKHEIVTYGWKKGTKHNWFSDRKQCDVIEIAHDKKTESVHPTQKPVGLIAYFLKNSSQPKEKILDLFGGSGSTLMACEQLGRQAYICEIDEKYCQVTIERFINFTKKPGDVVLIQNDDVATLEDIKKLRENNA